MGEIQTISEMIMEISPYYQKKGKSEGEYVLVYDSMSETLEPVYFFILDLISEKGYDPEKLIDNFSASPGSGYFSEMGQRVTIMQQQGAKILADVNTVLRSVLNVIYDLKEFRIRLQSYEDLHSKEEGLAEASKLALKQIWLDKVDFQKGNSGIKAMSLGQAGFQTLLDAFLAVSDIKDVKNVDLNERVKRIVSSRIVEFNAWVNQSEKELVKRYELERTYLKSQVNSLKLYTRWAKPYLIAATRLQNIDRAHDPHLVNTFNTQILELTIMGKKELDVKEAAIYKKLPLDFAKPSMLKKITKRKYYSILLIDFKFRGIPQKVVQQQHFTLGGRVEVTFAGYVLNEDEIAALYQKLDKSDIEDALQLVEGATSESLEHMQEEINFFLEEDAPEKNPIQKVREQSNPFLALIGGYSDSDNQTISGVVGGNKLGSKEPIIVRKDNWIEREHFRKVAGADAEEMAYTTFDVYKKAHGMPSYNPQL